MGASLACALEVPLMMNIEYEVLSFNSQRKMEAKSFVFEEED